MKLQDDPLISLTLEVINRKHQNIFVKTVKILVRHCYFEEGNWNCNSFCSVYLSKCDYSFLTNLTN